MCRDCHQGWRRTALKSELSLFPSAQGVLVSTYSQTVIRHGDILANVPGTLGSYPP